MTIKEPKSLNISDLDLASTQGYKIFMFLFPDIKKSSKYQFDNEFQIIDCIREGLPKQAIHSVLENTAISRTQLSWILHISTRQLNRYTDEDRLSSEQSNFLYEFSRLYVRATDILGDKTTTDNWLHRSNTALNGKSPIDMLDTVEGFRMVDDVLSQIEYGFFS
jgi:putative toxin-antitoxin system antitoxin component (TIGR02293 family)